jgi:hypothetical protein
VPTEDKLFLSFNMYFLVFYNIHNQEFLELNIVTIVVRIVVKLVPYSLSLCDIIPFNLAFTFMNFNFTNNQLSFN